MFRERLHDLRLRLKAVFKWRQLDRDLKAQLAYRKPRLADREALVRQPDKNGKPRAATR